MTGAVGFNYNLRKKAEGPNLYFASDLMICFC